MDYKCPTCKCNTCNNNTKIEGGWCKILKFAPCNIKKCSGNDDAMLIRAENYKEECKNYNK